MPQHLARAYRHLDAACGEFSTTEAPINPIFLQLIQAAIQLLMSWLESKHHPIPPPTTPSP